MSVDLKKYREERFKVEVGVDEYSPDQFKLAVTGNGYQWTCINLENKDELSQVRNAIDIFLIKQG